MSLNVSKVITATGFSICLILAACGGSDEPISKNSEEIESTESTQEESSGDLVIPAEVASACLLYTSPSPRDRTRSRMPSSA